MADYAALEAAKNAAQAAVQSVDEEIRVVLARKEQATRDSDRRTYEDCLGDLAWLGEQRKLREKEFQDAVAHGEATIRAEKESELETERDAADLDEARRKIDALAREAADMLVAVHRLRQAAVGVADEQRTHAERAKQLAADLGTLIILPALDRFEGDIFFGARAAHHAEAQGVQLSALRGIEAPPAFDFDATGADEAARLEARLTVHHRKSATAYHAKENGHE